MPTLHIRITWILYMHILHSVFYCDRSCCQSGAVTPLNNTDSKRFLYERHRRATFPRSSLDSVVFIPEAFISMMGLEPLSYKARCIATPMLLYCATAVARIVS